MTKKSKYLLITNNIVNIFRNSYTSKYRAVLLLLLISFPLFGKNDIIVTDDFSANTLDSINRYVLYQDPVFLINILLN